MSGVLILNSSYEPLTPVGIKRALRLVIDGKAEIVEHGESTINWGRGSLPRPEVIRLKKFIVVPRRFRRKVTNVFLFARDNYTCQYCGKHESAFRDYKGHANKLTRDHVKPLSKGGENSWTNCVTSCSPCNARKDDKTPEEAGMKLLKIPHEPHLVALMWTVRKMTAKQRKYVTLFFGADFEKVKF